MPGIEGAASLVWSSANALARRFSGDRTRLPARVVSVGNIQAGGAGKTPLVGWFAREADRRGLGVCILSRGYRGAWESEGGVLAPGETAFASQCGDEPALLRELAPRAWIGVGADRVRQFGRVLERKGGSIDLVILDDGFQNFRLHKDLEIVALTSASPSKKVFRDFSGALKGADLLVWTKGNEMPLSDPSLRDKLVRVRFRLRLPAGLSPDQGFFFVSGLADGEEARRSAVDAGMKIEQCLNFPDHARYSRKEIDSILDQAKRADLKVALTGKDWVKWRELGVPASAVTVFEPEIEISDSDRRRWEQIVWTT
ncbi:MAG: tetraacyldisaccharide 4'-kinase [Oligoflexia bacterium]|nr:tetraacyldisaccharide 4'-kinase [Oligoflexia bacterium]